MIMKRKDRKPCSTHYEGPYIGSLHCYGPEKPECSVLDGRLKAGQCTWGGHLHTCLDRKAGWKTVKGLGFGGLGFEGVEVQG